ncbi:HNH endonuclease family protein [Tessaracoccus sp.]
MNSRIVASLATAALFAVTGCSSADTASVSDSIHQAFTSVQTQASSAVNTAVKARGGTALALLNTLPVKGRAPKTGYKRSQFGQAWLDANRNGCDTRNDTLNHDLSGEVMSGRCKVMSGTLAHDPYTNRTIHYVRGGKLANGVDIDHMVALGNAWVTGAQKLDMQSRAALANDPLNLRAVDPSANRAKSDGDAATWLPANKAFRCTYVATQVAVKAKYRLWVTKAEKDAITRVLNTCPTLKAPSGGNPARVAFPVKAPA